MLFSSLNFLGFISIIFLIYPLLRLRGQNLFLLIASYAFYAFWDWRFTALLCTSTLIDYWVGQKLEISNRKTTKKLLLFFSIAVNLGILGFFKYFNFFIDSAVLLLSSIGFEQQMFSLKLILPIGISFYTFKTMTYTIDIYRGTLKPTKNLVDYALFVSFFPQILAGPIDRASTLIPQIVTPRIITKIQVLTGLNLILLGYFKKIAIADTLAPIVSTIFDTPGAMSSGQLWTGVYAYTLQIYGDFSGYTDIGRGIAMILGFNCMVNFKAPYLSRSFTEFWRRWHISLSTWFRDYLYIPLGGSHQSKTRTYANLLITMLLCGLWHGAAWTFILWGLIHGLFLMGHRILLNGSRPDFSWPKSFSGWIANSVKIFFTFHLVSLAWVLFRSPDVTSAMTYYKGLFSFHQFTGISTTVIFAGLLVIFLDIMQTWFNSQTWLTDRHNLRFFRYSVAQILFLGAITAAIAHLGTSTPFIYFQF